MKQTTGLDVSGTENEFKNNIKMVSSLEVETDTDFFSIGQRKTMNISTKNKKREKKERLDYWMQRKTRKQKLRLIYTLTGVELVQYSNFPVLTPEPTHLLPNDPKECSFHSNHLDEDLS